MTEQQNQGILPALYTMTKQQALIAGIPAGVSVIADIATHANPGVMFVGGLLALAIGVSSKEVAEMVIPGSNPDQVRASLDAVVQATTPDIEEEYADQRALSKLRRLLHDKHPDLYETQDVARPGDRPAQPKDGAMRAMVDGSEDEYLAPLPTPELPPIFPAYPENERLDLGSVLATGQTFAPHFNALFGKGVIASAVQGSGKSQLLGRLIEQAAKCGVPMVVCDHKGEYAPVTELSFVNGLRAGSAELRGHTGQCEYFELSVGNADEFVSLVMQGRYQAIIDLPSYGDSWLVRAEIVAEVGQALMRYAATQRKAGALLLPCLVALDEAQLYLPQNVNLLPPEAKKSTEILDSLNNAYFSLVSNGRSNGYTVVFATQSLTYIAKWAIKSCQIKIFGRHVEKNDLDMCGETISPKIATRADIETFLPGVGVVFGFTPTAMVVKFDLRLSRDDSETPGLERLRMPARKSAQPVQALPDLSTLFDEEEESVSFEELCDAVAEMAMAGESDREIMGQLDLNREDYITIAKYIQSHLGEFRGDGRSAEKTPSRPNLSVVHREDQELPGTSDASRDMAVNEPTEQPGATSDRFVPREDDLLLSEVQGRLLEVWYQVNHNVEESLKQIRNERGQGLGSRYNRHASYLLEQAGLKKRRA